MDTIVGIVGITLTVVALAVGIRKPDISTAWKTFLSALEVVALIASVVVFGWGGLIAFVAAGALAILISSVRLYARHESILVSAAIEGGRTKEEMQTLYQRLKRADKALKWLGPIETAELIRLLAQRARSPVEIEAIERRKAPPRS